MLLRRYQPSDQDQILSLHTLALVHASANVPGPWDNDIRAVETEYLSRGGEFLVVEINAQVVGMGALRRVDAKTAEIKRMRVHPGYHRKGIGQRILNSLEERARELAYEVLVLDTLPRQIAARGLYEANGYRKSGRGSFQGEEIVLYKKRLPKSGP